MNPNAALAMIRKLVDEIDRSDDEWTTACLADELCQHIEGLDAWLSRGGFLPKAWTSAAK